MPVSLSLSLLLAAATPAPGAQTPLDKPTFLYAEGTAHYGQGLFRQAIGEFLEADRMRPNPALAYDVAQTYEKLGDPEHAAAYYRIYLERQPGAADRPVVEATIHSLDSWVALRRLANEDPGGGFRKLGFYTLAASAAVGALGLTGEVIADNEPTSNRSAAAAFRATADLLFVGAGVGLLSAGLFFLLGTTDYASHQTAVALLPGPGGFAWQF